MVPASCSTSVPTSGHQLHKDWVGCSAVHEKASRCLACPKPSLIVMILGCTQSYGTTCSLPGVGPKLERSSVSGSRDYMPYKLTDHQEKAPRMVTRRVTRNGGGSSRGETAHPLQTAQGLPGTQDKVSFLVPPVDQQREGIRSLT